MACVWLSSFDKRVPYKIQPYKKFNIGEYSFLQNGELEISRLSEIPIDYFGIIAIPVTFFFINGMNLNLLVHHILVEQTAHVRFIDI